MKPLEMYVTYVITPIENNIKELQACYYSKNILKYPHKKLYKKYMNEYTKLLQEKLKHLEQMMDEEEKFRKNLFLKNK